MTHTEEMNPRSSFRWNISCWNNAHHRNTSEKTGTHQNDIPV